MVHCMFVNVHDCDCVIEVVVHAHVTCGVYEHTYLIRVSKKTNMLDKI